VTLLGRIAKAKVAGSNPVFRSIQDPDAAWFFPPLGVAAFERFERVSPWSVRLSLLLTTVCTPEHPVASACNLASRFSPKPR